MGKSNRNDGNSARQQGLRKKRRRHRADRREATKGIREIINKSMRREGHPGWS